MRMKSLSKLLMPDYYFEHYYDISPDFLLSKDIRVLLIDIDNTIAPYEIAEPDERIKEWFDALKKAQEKGVKIVLASGRPTYGIVPVAKQLELEKNGGYILSFNGGKIINAETNEVIYQKTLPEEMPALLYDLAQEYKVNIMTYLDETIITPKAEDKYVEIESRINKMQVRQVEDFKSSIKATHHKSKVVGTPIAKDKGKPPCLLQKQGG